MKRVKTIDNMFFELMPYIDAPPVNNDSLFKQACSSDEITVKTWKPTWIGNAKANHERFGSFAENSIGKIYKKFDKMPAIIAGSGPSLNNSVEVLKKHKSNIPLISCLHNFHFFVDNEIKVDYFVSLDAGEVTIEEISEGGKLSHEEYVEKTKDFTLLCYIGTSPRLLEQWKGKVLFFNAPVPELETSQEIEKIEKFNIFISNGGNVLGACMYIAKAILGCTPICFIGADFCFSYDNQFHPWKSKYDADLGTYMRWIDIWGNSVRTWTSYYNFKCWFDHMCHKLPGIWINCSQDGILGSYVEGNIRKIQQMPLINFLESYNLYEQLEPVMKDPINGERLLLF